MARPETFSSYWRKENCLDHQTTTQHKVCRAQKIHQMICVNRVSKSLEIWFCRNKATGYPGLVFVGEEKRMSY